MKISIYLFIIELTLILCLGSKYKLQSSQIIYNTTVESAFVDKYTIHLRWISTVPIVQDNCSFITCVVNYYPN